MYRNDAQTWLPVTRHSDFQLCTFPGRPVHTKEMPLGELWAASKRPTQAGIITQRRQPPRVGQPRRPVDRFVHKVKAEPMSWDMIQRLNHCKWELNTGAKVKAAEAVAMDTEAATKGDALDHLVQIQRNRQLRLEKFKHPPAIVGRLLAPPHVEAPPMDALDLFAEHVRAQAEFFAVQTKPGPSTKANPFKGQFVQPGMPTKMGLYYARREA